MIAKTYHTYINYIQKCKNNTNNTTSGHRSTTEGPGTNPEGSQQPGGGAGGHLRTVQEVADGAVPGDSEEVGMGFGGPQVQNGHLAIKNERQGQIIVYWK